MDKPIAVNGRFLLRPVTGVERYARELLARLPDELRVLQPARTGGGFFGHWWEQTTLPRLAGEDLLWSPANTGPIRARDHVLTLHDASLLDHPEWFRPALRIWYRLLLPALVRRAQFVMTISEFSRRRIAAHFPAAADRIRVVHAGVDGERFRPLTQQRIDSATRNYGVRPPYFLFVGPAGPRKDFATLLSAWREFVPNYPGTTLVVVGEAAATLRAGSNGRYEAGILRLGRVADRELHALYAGALALLYPSRYEGFGLPCLEALACGTQVVAGRIPALQEVMGPMAHYFEPQEVGELVRGMGEVVEAGRGGDAERRRRREFALGYSWERAAQSAWNVLQEATAASA